MSRKFSIFNTLHYKPQRDHVTLVGAGTQGRRLAYMWSSRGHTVHLVDVNPQQLEDAVRHVEHLRTLSEHPNADWGLLRTHGFDKLPEALQESWLVVECVPENLLLKRKVIVELDHVAPVETIVASNSSSFTIGEILNGLDLLNDRQMLSAHSYWPPETTTLEIMGHKYTDGACIKKLMTRAREHGFSPFLVKKESMGYIYNRIWAAIKRESLLVAAEGVAVPSEIDAVFKDVLKAQKGPFELMDHVGLDVVLAVEEHYAIKRSNTDTRPQEYLRAQLAKGRLGVKSGKGFYDHTIPDPPPADDKTNGTTNGTTNGVANGASNGASNGTDHAAPNGTTNGTTVTTTNGTHDQTANGVHDEVLNGASDGITSEAATNIFRDNWTFGPKTAVTCTVIAENGQEE